MAAKKSISLHRFMKDQKSMQYSTWKFQSKLTCLVLIPSLMIIALLINFHQGFNYSDGIVLNGNELIIIVVFLVLYGLMSLGLSYRPDLIDYIGTK